MVHPALLLVPVLMLADYFLTVAGARLAERGYRQHFKFADYEMNPLFQKAIAAKRWINWRHLGMTGLVTLGLIFGLASFADTDPFYQGIFGAVLTVYATIIGAHLANIWTFAFMARHGQQVSGEVTMSQRYLLNITRARLLCALLPVGGIAWFTRSPMVLGGIGGIVGLMGSVTIWLWRDGRRRKRLAAQTPAVVQ